MKNLLIISIACLLFACKKELPGEALPFEQKLVLNSIIRPDTTIVVFLSENLSIVDFPEPNPVTNATILLFEDEVLLGTLKDTVIAKPEGAEEISSRELSGFYVMDYLPKAGKKYRIEVEHPDFPSITAITEIPVPSSLFNVTISDPKILRYDDFSNLNEPSLVEYKATVDIQDSPKRNFYHIAVIGENFKATPNDEGELVNYSNLFEVFYSSNDIVFDEVENPLFQNEDLFSFYWNRHVFDDKLFNSQTYDVEIVFQISVGVSAASFSGDGERTIRGVFRRFFVEVRSVSEEYYRYNKTISIKEAIAGDPFAEPVQIYSNIENGYGIFAGYNPELFEFSLAEFIPEE